MIVTVLPISCNSKVGGVKV